MRVFIAGLVATVLWCSGVYADNDGSAIGGRGGQDFRGRCPEGMLLRGLDIRAGDDVDQVTALCARLKPDGTADPNIVRTPSFGGTGGSPHSLICPSFQPFIESLYIGAVGQKTILVSSIRMSCGKFPKSGNNASVLSFSASPTTNANATEGPSNCGMYNVVVGIRGRSGAMVDSLGVICDDPEHLKPPPITVTRPTSNSATIRRP